MLSEECATPSEPTGFTMKTLFVCACKKPLTHNMPRICVMCALCCAVDDVVVGLALLICGEGLKRTEINYCCNLLASFVSLLLYVLIRFHYSKPRVINITINA